MSKIMWAMMLSYYKTRKMLKFISISDDFMQLLYGFKNMVYSKPMPTQKQIYAPLNKLTKENINLEEDIFSYKFQFFNLLKSSALLCYKAFALIGHGAAADKHLHYIQKFCFSYYDDDIMAKLCYFYNNLYKNSELDLKNKNYNKKREAVENKILNYFVLHYEGLPNFNNAIKLFQESDDITILYIAAFLYRGNDDIGNLLSHVTTVLPKYSLSHFVCLISLFEKLKELSTLKKIVIMALKCAGHSPDWNYITNIILHLYSKDSNAYTIKKITLLKDIELYIIGYAINLLIATEKPDLTELIIILKDLYYIAINSYNYANIQLISHLIANYLSPFQAASVKYYCLNYSFKQLHQASLNNNVDNQSIKLITCEKLQLIILKSLNDTSIPFNLSIETIENDFRAKLNYLHNHSEDQLVMVASDWALIIPGIKSLNVSIYSVVNESTVEINLISSFENLYIQFVKILQSAYGWYEKLIEIENQREIRLRIAIEEKQLSKLLDDVADATFGNNKYLLLGKYNKDIENTITQICTQIKDISSQVLHKYVNYKLTNISAQGINIPIDLLQIIQQINVSTPRSSTYLLIDNKISLFPFERLKIYKDECQRITRILTIDNIQPPFAIDPFNGYYILNPSGDLKSTQERLESYFTTKRMWNGVAGIEPNVKEIVNALTTRDLFMYIFK